MLGTGSFHGSSPQPQAAKVTELMSRLKLADTNLIDRFAEFLKTMGGNVKADAQNLRRKLCSTGKNTDYDNHKAVSDALAFISANKAILVGFDDELNRYASNIKAIKREMTSRSESCQCCFTYPPAKECVAITCMDLKSLEVDAWITNSLIDLFGFHLKGEHMLPELQSSAILEKYFIMNALYYQKLKDNEQNMGQLEREARNMKLGKIPFLLWPVNGGTGHWSLAITRNEDNKTATIFHMDSLRDAHDSKTIFNILEMYMRTVLQIHGDIRTQKLEVPRQRNLSDCGLFLMYNMKKFIMEYNDNLKFGAKWYRPEDASSLRSTIRGFIEANKMIPYQHDQCDYAKNWASSFGQRD